jgi:restriction system protein
MIPDYQTLMLPVLQAAKHDAVSISDVIPQLADEFGLTDAERAEMLPSGRITLFANRVHWAKTYLKQAGLIQQPRRAYYELTDRGRKALESNPSRIDNAYLSQFPEFIAFKTRSRSDDAEPIPKAGDAAATPANETPDELMRKMSN